MLYDLSHNEKAKDLSLALRAIAVGVLQNIKISNECLVLGPHQKSNRTSLCLA
jgi:hypothetical protein